MVLTSFGAGIRIDILLGIGIFMLGAAVGALLTRIAITGQIRQLRELVAGSTTADQTAA
jgi:hypothetical protein